MGTKKEMAYLCQCNNCNTILIDKNPQSCAVMHELNGTESEMQYVDDKDGGYWVCPVCNTHDYLSDVITRRVSTQSKEVLNITDTKWELVKTNSILKPFLIMNGEIEICELHFGIKRSVPETYEEVEDNGKAICTAVNETYRKGYNPAAMDELYKALSNFVEGVDIIVDGLEDGQRKEVYKSIQKSLTYTTAKTALQNAKL